MWAKIMRERFGATAPKALMLRFHTQTGGSTLTAQQPQNNIVRTALQALAAVLGGTQSLHTNSFDEALALPTEDSARIALRTQQIIGYESGVTAAIDPLAGSLLCGDADQRDRKARQRLPWEDRHHGRNVEGHRTWFCAAGNPERGLRVPEIGGQQGTGAGRRERFPTGSRKAVSLLKMDPELERRQVERLRAFRAKRDPEKADAAIRKVDEAARNGENLMPIIVEAVESQCDGG